MAEDTIKLEVVTPLRLAVATSVAEVAAPSVDGEFGVLPGHRPLLAALQHGRVTYVEGQTVKQAAVGPGFAEVNADRVVLLVENWMSAEKIDLDQTRDELAQAELRLRELEGQEHTAEYDQASRRQKWAAVRLEVAEKFRQI